VTEGEGVSNSPKDDLLLGTSSAKCEISPVRGGVPPFVKKTIVREKKHLTAVFLYEARNLPGKNY
jgi:hypothetical protein